MFKKYEKFSYIYPPRPEWCIPESELPNYDNDSYIAQPKLNGSNVTLYINGAEWKNFGRHKNENLSNFKLTDNDIESLNLPKDKWHVIVGEYMNKNKKDGNNEYWNHHFVVFDILVFNSEHLLGSTFEERVKLMDNIFGTKDENGYLYKISDNIYRVKSFYDNFQERWNEIVKIDMFEGFVLKKKSQKLTPAFSEKNNMSHKCRKPTKNYSF
jgi:hypothetical protein